LTSERESYNEGIIVDKNYCLSKALAHIEQHLTERIELEDLADTANYSPWHFHRLFHAIIGYGVGDYIRRRRFSEASRELVFTSNSIGGIALKYQFESQAAFTRAFKSFHGITPGLLRNQHGPLIRFSPINLNQYFRHYRKGDNPMQPRFEHKSTFTVAGLTCQSTMSNNTIPQLWGSFGKREKDFKNRVSEDCYGVCFYERMENMCPNTPFTYLAGMLIKSEADIPEGMTARTVPACDYAVFEHKGALDTLQKTYDYIFREWLPGSEYEFINQDDFEIYDERFKFGQPESIMEIWIPVKKK
jgi:AraC family transcriptional regulator